ncbi:alanine racemase [Agreia bicolorata]|uniref:Alanine racemase n=1 Tax=Agreia bicolorata TaxID=110935 RepID=A0A1T4XP62_9MICO|nr:alanine racemase [Agreia bicolorata]SKA91317.1 alanine racemase [Agreia bicolorata]
MSAPGTGAPTAPDSVALIDLAAVRHNVARFLSLADGAQVMTVVKANAYGHGAVEVARAALDGGATWLGVADLAEAFELRDAGITEPVLAWLHESHENFAAALEAGIDIGVSDLGQLGALAEAQRAVGGAPASVHLKLDTGLGRNGADEPNWRALFAEARRLELAGHLIVRGVFSHLSNADDAEDARQLERLHVGVEAAHQAGLRPQLRHLASTAAALRLPATWLDLVRVGIGAYGLSPLDGVDSAALALRPVMTLRSTIVAVAPSSDADFAARSGIVPLGYGDGIPPQAAGRIHVTGDGGRLLVTRIESDHLVVEPVSPGADSARGDVVTLFGDPAQGVASVDDWARAADTINYEIVTRLGARVARKYTE